MNYQINPIPSENGQGAIDGQNQENLDCWQVAKLGRLYAKTARYDEALPYFNRAIMMNDEAVAFYYYRGVTLFKLGKWEHALRDFEKALSGNAWNQIEILNYTGCIRFRLGDVRGSKRDIARVLNAYKGLLNDLVMTTDEYMELMEA